MKSKRPRCVPEGIGFPALLSGRCWGDESASDTHTKKTRPAVTLYEKSRRVRMEASSYSGRRFEVAGIGLYPEAEEDEGGRKKGVT